MDDGTRVMVVEDDPAVRSAVGRYLQSYGFSVEAFADGAAAWRALQRGMPDVMVVDRMLPGMSGDELCREARSVSEVPILMLTALGELEERLEGLELGADDYLPKPFSLRELTLRVTALVRRSRAQGAVAASIASGDFRIDPVHRRAWVRGEEIVLTAREYELLLFLVRNPGRTVSRDELIREVWGWSFGEASTVTVHARRLREKIERDPADPRYLRTEWGAGYRFSVDGREA